MIRNLLFNNQIYPLITLTPKLTNEFENFYDSYFKNKIYRINNLKKASFEYFSKCKFNSASHDAYFNNFNHLWLDSLQKGDYLRAKNIWYIALEIVNFCERKIKNHIHKGTPFYFLGVTCCLMGDTENGFLYMHQALDEDYKTTKEDAPKTPSLSFVTLDFENSGQFFRDYLLNLLGFLKEYINEFNELFNKNLDEVFIRRRFLEVVENKYISFLFCYSLARLKDFREKETISKNNEFAGLVELDLLFNFLLVIEESIKEKSKTGRFFSNQLNFLNKLEDINIPSGKIHILSDSFRDDFPKTLITMLNGTFIFDDATRLNNIERIFGILLGLRNRAAHDISQGKHIYQHFEALHRLTLFGLFFIIDQLY